MKTTLYHNEGQLSQKSEKVAAEPEGKPFNNFSRALLYYRARALHIMRKPIFASPFGRACFSVAIKTADLYKALLSPF